MGRLFIRFLTLLFGLWLSTSSVAKDYLIINQDLTRGGEYQVKLRDVGTEFYRLSIFSKGVEVLYNDQLIPRGIKSSGGLDMFQGIFVVDNSISIRYRFCSPSKSVCYDRNLISNLRQGQFYFLEEEVITTVDKIALAEVFYPKRPILLASLTFQDLLENNDMPESVFNNVYGDCVAKLGGDSLMKISEELEKDSPGDWVLRKGCVTVALVFNLEAQKYISQKAAYNYLSLTRQNAAD